jgi:uncharacterized membrane protein YfcA
MLTFFSGFGLGTLLMPVFALFFPVETAVAATGVVHLSNNLFKIALVGKHISYSTLWRFGIPAIIGAFIGAWCLSQLAGLEAWAEFSIFGVRSEVLPINLVIGVLLVAFAIKDLVQTNESGFSAKWLPLGGTLSGFFGGLSGHQGALRSAFLIQLGLKKETYIATGIAIACLVDFTRIPVYFKRVNILEEVPLELFSVAVVAAFAGAYIGKLYLKKLKLITLHRIVAAAMIAVAFLLVFGWI